MRQKYNNFSKDSAILKFLCFIGRITIVGNGVNLHLFWERAIRDAIVLFSIRYKTNQI